MSSMRTRTMLGLRSAAKAETARSRRKGRRNRMGRIGSPLLQIPRRVHPPRQVALLRQQMRVDLLVILVRLGARGGVELDDAGAELAEGRGVAAGALVRERGLDRGAERGPLGALQADGRDAENIGA